MGISWIFSRRRWKEEISCQFIPTEYHDGKRNNEEYSSMNDLPYIFFAADFFVKKENKGGGYDSKRSNFLKDKKNSEDLE